MPVDAAFCPVCGYPVNAQGQRNQNQWKNDNSNYYAPNYQARPQYEMKDTGITIIFAALIGLFGIMGIGHIYLGKVGKGVAILIGGFVIAALMYVVTFSLLWSEVWLMDSDGNVDFVPVIIFMVVAVIIYFAYYVWQVFDAHKLAKHYNEELIRTGKPPW